MLCSLETTKAVILPELLELADDEESDVRIMGLDTFVNILSLLDDGELIVIVSLKFNMLRSL